MSETYGHERIWVSYYDADGKLVVAEKDMKDELGGIKDLDTDTEYVRADLYTALEDAAREALGLLEGKPLPCRYRLRDIVAKLTKLLSAREESQ